MDWVCRNGVPDPADDNWGNKQIEYPRANATTIKKKKNSGAESSSVPEPPFPLFRSLSSFLFWISSLNTRTMLTNLPRADKGLLLLLPPWDVLGDASGWTGERPKKTVGLEQKIITKASWKARDGNNAARGDVIATKLQEKKKKTRKQNHRAKVEMRVKMCRIVIQQVQL